MKSQPRRRATCRQRERRNINHPRDTYQTDSRCRDIGTDMLHRTDSRRRDTFHRDTERMDTKHLGTDMENVDMEQWKLTYPRCRTTSDDATSVNLHCSIQRVP
jgi:hypothetical protein